MRGVLFSGVLAILFALLASQRAMAESECESLKPHNAQDIEESFKGEIEGEINGLLSKLTGGKADIVGEYKKLYRDTLKEYPDSNNLYVWQRIIYLACVRPDGDIDINKLFELYLIGPPKDENAEIDNSITYKCVADNSLTASYNLNGKPLQNAQLFQNVQTPNVEAFFGIIFLADERTIYRRSGSGNYTLVMDKSIDEYIMQKKAFERAIRNPSLGLMMFLSYHEEYTDTTSQSPGFSNSESRNLLFINTQGFLGLYVEVDVFDPRRNKYALSAYLPISSCTAYEASSTGFDRNADSADGSFPKEQYGNGSAPSIPQDNYKNTSTSGEECDRLAGNAFDSNRNRSYEGANYQLLRVNFSVAASACQTAYAENPSVLRFRYQHARALQAGKLPEAKQHLQDLIQRDYPAAYDNLGWLFFNERKVPQAIALFERGSELGSAEAMMSLASFLSDGKWMPMDKPRARHILHKAAEIGHPSAIKELRRIERDDEIRDAGINLIGSILHGILKR